MYASRSLYCASLLIFSITLIASRQAAAQAGQLDPTFGQGGIVTTDFGTTTSTSNEATANAVIIQPDGKILVVGGAPTSTGFPTAVLARYNTNGSPDTTFGIAGVEVTDGVPVLSSVTLQTNGAIVATGEAGIDVTVVRYKPNGTLDPTFGTGGIATVEAFGATTSGVVVQPDGRIVIANGGLFRFLSNGQLDTTFGTGGTTKVAGFDPSGLTLLPDGKLVVSCAFDNGGDEFLNSGSVSRYNSDGSMDTSFGINGQLATPGPANGLVFLSSGEFVVAGSIFSNTAEVNGGFQPSTGFAVSRYEGAGFADGKFGAHAGVFTALANYPNVLTSGVGVQSTGNIVAVGSAANLYPLAFALTRYTAAGQLDTTFGTDGIVITSFGSNTLAAANGLAIQPDNKIVAIGSYTTTGFNFDTAFKVTRYLGQ
jgi:uncharacterized delta-60 repeat protein